MKLQPFKKLIAMSKEKLDEAMAPVHARKVKAKAELKKAEIDTKLITLESEIQELCVDKDIKLDVLIDKLDEQAILERRKKQYDKILVELFPED